MTARPVGLVAVGRLYTEAEVEAQTAQLVGERDAAVFELLDLRAELRVLGRRVREQAVRLAEHPTRVDRLTAEVEQWAGRCGAAEADLDAVRSLHLGANGRLACDTCGTPWPCPTTRTLSRPAVSR